MFLRELKKRNDYRASKFIEAKTNPENFLERILEFNPKLVVFIDAANIGETPGDMNWIDAGELDTARISTHAFNITMIEEYLKARQSVDVKYFGITPETTRFGYPASDAIKRRIQMFFQ